jgi:amino acid transporter
MKNMLSKLFGPNWRSSTSGILTVVAICTAFAIHGDNSLVAFLPDKAEEYIVGFSKLIAVVSGIIFALTVKDAAVTGGKIAQTKEAKKRIKKEIGYGENI